ncbi:MAG: hypothetical protein RJA70_3536 [Pseudomonadota bacterium]
MRSSAPASRTERLAILTSSFPREPGDPSGHFVLAEVRQLVSAGHDVSVLVPYATRLPADLERKARVVQLPGGSLFGWPGALPRLKTNPLRALALPQWLTAARRELRAGHYDRVIAHWLLPCGWPAASAFCGPLEIIVHGSDLELLSRLPLWLRRYVLRELLCSDVSPTRATAARFRCVSAALQDELLRLGKEAGLCEQRLAQQTTVQACALDLGVVPSRAEARRLLGLDPQDFHALSVGRLIESKRVDRALSCTQVPQHAHWTVLGDGPLLPALQARFPQVRFIGAVPRPTALLWMRAADVIVSASEREGAPTVIREARALGTAVWTSAVGDVALWAALDPGIRVLDELG